MRKAVKRPYARMDGDYHYPPAMPIPNYVNFRTVSQVLAQRAQCYLLLGQPEQALQELTLIHDLRRVLENAPTGKPMTLVTTMINVGVAGLYADTIADGFRLHAWQKPQLIMLQKQLGQIDLAPFAKESFQNEQASVLRIFQTAMERVFEIQRATNATIWQKIRNLRPPYVMRGFFYFNIINVARTDQMIIDSIDPSKKIVSPEKAAVFQREMETLRHTHPWQLYKLLAVIAVPDFTRAVQTFAFQQTKADEAQIVCALENYRLAQGKYPGILDELVPQFIEKIPHDIIGGQQLKYHLTPDGQFTLYSVGWNETDDGGQVYPSSYDQGDWVWQ